MIAFETSRPVYPERCTVLLVSAIIRRERVLWEVVRLWRSPLRQPDQDQLPGDQISDAGIDPVESFALAWQIGRLAMAAIWAQAKGRLGIRPRYTAQVLRYRELP
jgi:hypothetical protein